jgi:hypothetical protein
MTNHLESQKKEKFTLEQYSELTVACDDLLTDLNLQPDIVANSWLHILNEHPSNLKRYMRVFDTEPLITRYKREIREILTSTRLFLHSIFNSIAFSRKVKLPNVSKIDVLFITQFVTQNVNNSIGDFYYGNLSEELANKGISSLFIAQNQTKIPTHILHKHLNQRGGPPTVLLPNTLDMRTGIRYWLRAWKLSKKICGLKMERSTLKLKKIIKYASQEALSKSTISNLQFGDLIKEACTLYRPRNIVVLWEGHAWERVALQSARLADKEIRCIAYQHTILFPKAHALKRPLACEFNPDIILTIGELNRELLTRLPAYSAVSIFTYGSHRRLHEFPSKKFVTFARYLILPEGIESECITLFDYTISIAKEMPNAFFILRTHPIITPDNIIKRHERFRNLPKNVKFSANHDINIDIESCECVIYRGSSTVVYAVLAGLRPFYLEIPGELSIDPLHDLKVWREKVSSPKDLIHVNKKLSSLDFIESYKSWEVARQFCERYIKPAQIDVFLSILKI